MNFSSMFSGLGSTITLIVVVPFVLVALLLLVWALRGRRKAKASMSWPTTIGKVLASYVEPRRSSDSDGGYSTSYYPVVLYEYSVDGQPYQSNRVSFGPEVGRGGPGAPQQSVARYPVGAQVEVYYNPDSPAEAVLEHSSPGSKILIWVVVLIVVIVAVTTAFTMGMLNFVR